MKKNCLKLFVFIAFILLYPNNLLSQNEEKGTRFVVLGHLYPITKDPERLNKFIEKVNSYNADYIFVLGDSRLNNKKLVDYLNNNFNAKVFYSPGNTDLKHSIKKYEENIGYFNKVIYAKDIRFILLNSSDSLENIQKFLQNNLSDDFLKGKTILLTHHRIWDDSIISKKPFEHDKSYYFEDIYNIIDGKIHAIFSGNSKRQYFRDLEDNIDYQTKLERVFGKQNVNVLYWADKVGSIYGYSVGMGNALPKATFVIVDVVKGNLLINGDYSSIENYKILPKNLISHNKDRLSCETKAQCKKFQANKYYLLNKTKVRKIIYILAFILIIFFSYKIFLKIRKK